MAAIEPVTDPTALRTIQGTDDAGRLWTAYTGAGGCWSAAAQEDKNGWWRIWLVPPEKGKPLVPLWERGQWSAGYARGVAEHIARALAVIAAAADRKDQEEA